MTKKEIFLAIKEASSQTGIECRPLATLDRFTFNLVAGKDYIRLPYRKISRIEYGVDYIVISLSKNAFIKVMNKYNVIIL